MLGYCTAKIRVPGDTAQITQRKFGFLDLLLKIVSDFLGSGFLGFRFWVFRFGFQVLGFVPTP
jgi:hypothetical protein